MYTLKIITTVLIMLLMLVIWYFMKDYKWKRKRDHASIIGFSIMQLVYFLALVCMWT